MAWRTQINHILSSCLISLSVSIFFLLSYSDSWMSLSILGISWNVISSVTSVMHMWSFYARAPSSFQYEWNRHYITCVPYILSLSGCIRIIIIDMVIAINTRAAFNTQSRSSPTSYAILSSESQMNCLRFWTWYCVACQWSMALCIKCRSIWKQVMEIYR